MNKGIFSSWILMLAMMALPIKAMEDSIPSGRASFEETYSGFSVIDSKVVRDIYNFAEKTSCSTNQCDDVLSALQKPSTNHETTQSYLDSNDLVRFINDRSKIDSNHKAIPVSLDSMPAYQLLILVKNNIAINMPVLVYYVTEKRIQLGILIGIRGNELLMLNSLCEGEQKLSTIHAGALINKMNVHALLLEGEKPGERIFPQYKPFNLISFTDHDGDYEGAVAFAAFVAGWTWFAVYCAWISG